MAAPVRMEAMAFSDPRFEALGQLGGYNAHEARGRMALLWSFCTEKGTDIVSPAIVRACLAVSAADLKDAELGDILDDGRVRVRGATEERIGWYLPEVERRESAKRAGKARAATAQRDERGRLVSASAASTPPADGPATHQRTSSDPPADVQRPPASLSLSPSPSQEEDERQRERRAHAPARVMGAPAPADGSAAPWKGEERRSPDRPAEPKPTGCLDVYRALADEIWAEQESALAELRASGIDPASRPLGLLSSAKAELIRRISERAAGADLQVAAADCRHALAVWLAEAEAKHTLRFFDGSHWKADRFQKALVLSPKAVVELYREQQERERRRAIATGAPVPSAPPPKREKPKPREPELTPEQIATNVAAWRAELAANSEAPDVVRATLLAPTADDEDPEEFLAAAVADFAAAGERPS